MSDTPEQKPKDATEVQTDENETETRRTFLVTLAGGFAAAAPRVQFGRFIDSIAPGSDAIASGAPLEIDLSPIKLGKQKVVRWRGLPIFVFRRTPEELRVLQEAQDKALLADPDSDALQQPSYAKSSCGRSSTANRFCNSVLWCKRVADRSP
jgi:ubiquinol-cytochrome c reductase iron-sulfur subunit